jgi:hypothetical protein
VGSFHSGDGGDSLLSVVEPAVTSRHTARRLNFRHRGRPRRDCM